MVFIPLIPQLDKQMVIYGGLFLFIVLVVLMPVFTSGSYRLHLYNPPLNYRPSLFEDVDHVAHGQKIGEIFRNNLV